LAGRSGLPPTEVSPAGFSSEDMGFYLKSI
jgi:hypothetical protein